MELYLLAKLIHILSATVLFGTGAGIAFFMWQADRSGNATVMAKVAHYVVRADQWLTAPAVVIQPLSGFWLMHILGVSWSTPWVLASLVLYVLIGCFWIPVVFIQIRVARITAHLAETGQTRPDSLKRAMRWWYSLGWPAFLSVLVIFYLMVFKPVI